MIIFDANGGTGGTMPNNITLPNKNTATSDMNGGYPERSGYAFAGWSATPSWSRDKRVAYTQSQGGQTASDGTTARITQTWTYEQWCTNTGGDSSRMTLTLYAQWDEGIIEEEVVIEEG